MTPSHRTKVVSVHRVRRRARARERSLQRSLEIVCLGGSVGWRHSAAAEEKAELDTLNVPSWARGARVEKAGRFQWAVVATEDRHR